MRLRDVIDFETQLSRDTILPTQQLASRDKRLLQSIKEVPRIPPASSSPGSTSFALRGPTHSPGIKSRWPYGWYGSERCWSVWSWGG